MKKSLLVPVALAVLGAFAGAAQAQSNVTIFGRIDVGVSHNTEAYSSSQYQPTGNNAFLSPANNQMTGVGGVTSMSGAGLGASQLGFRGTEDLGNGMKVGFNAVSNLVQNSGFLASQRGSMALNNRGGNDSAGDGSCNGQFFCEYYAIIQTPSAGTFTVGRQTSLMQENVVASDIMTAAPAYSLTGFTGTFGGAGATRESKWDNSIKWKTKLGGLDAGAAYRIGGSNQNTATNAAFALSLGVKQASWGVTAVYEKVNDAQTANSACNFATNTAGLPVGYGSSESTVNCNTGATAGVAGAASGANIGTVSLIFNDLSAWNIGGYFKPTDNLTAKGGYWRTVVSNPTNPQADYAVNNTDGYVVSGASWVNRYATNQTQQYLYAGLQYDAAANQRFYLATYRYFVGGYMQNGIAAQATTPYYKTTSTAYSNPLGENVVSISTQYDLSKRTTLYGGVMHVWITGQGAANVFGSPNFVNFKNTDISVGVRHNF